MTWAAADAALDGPPAGLHLGPHAGVERRAASSASARGPQAAHERAPCPASCVYRPSTSVSTMSLRAPSATASAAAAVSALTLSTCVGSSMSGATVLTTGMRPASSRSSTAPGLTLHDVADEADVDALAVHDRACGAAPGTARRPRPRGRPRAGRAR